LKLKSSWIALLLITISAVLLVGCRARFPTTSTPLETQYQYADINSSIKLVRVKSILEKDNKVSGIDVATIGDDVFLDLENHSDRTIQFTPDGGVIYYMFDKGLDEWVIIEDRRINMNTEPALLLPKNSPDYLSGFYNITPNIPWELGSKELFPIRVVVCGNCISSNGDVQEVVCATFDLFFEPPRFD